MVKKDFKNTNAVNKFISNQNEEEEVPSTYSEGNTPDTVNTVNASNTQKQNIRTRQQKHPRINMAFYKENHEYLEYITRLRGVSITQYVNDLIAKDAEINKETIEKLKALMNE